MPQATRTGSTQTTTRQKRLEQYFDLLIKHGIFHTRGEIAAQCGASDSSLSQALSDPKRWLTIEQCLRLALKVEESPAEVLRKAGRDDVAKIIDVLWPEHPEQLHLTRSERKLVRQWRDLTLPQRHHLMALIEIFADTTRANTTGPNGRVRSGARASRPTSTPATIA